MNTHASDVRAKRAALAGIDAACWGLAGLVLLGARYDFTLNLNQWQSVAGYLGVAMVSTVILGYIVQLYRGRYRVGSMDETVLLGAVVACAAVISGLGFLWVPGFARGLVISVPPAALLLMQFFRLAIRVNGERKRVSKPSDRRTLIYGAGDAGTQLLRLISINSNPPFHVVGFIDDDPAKRHRHIGAVGVLGNGEQLLDIIADKRIDTVILAITNATGDLIGELSNQLDLAGVKLLILPALRDMIHGQVSLSQLHEVDVNDILGRQANHTDLQAIADYLNDKAVLITGAGGSIGSEIARQVHRFGPRELVLLDRDESALHGVQLSIYGVGLLDTRDMVLCDIRDVAALDAVFAEHKPQVVFHAAALKHLPMLEQYPEEGWKTNVLGTLNVLQAAGRHGVERLVNISTDKAADPTSVLGKTKRIAEQLTAWHAEHLGGLPYLSVRFGNVLGSRGSMVHTFAAQIKRGGPVTVTHPQVERYFMTIPEACELTIHAGAVGKPADVLVLDMGKPVKIIDVARRLITQSRREIQIEITGLRPGEKLSEVLFSENEDATPTDHPLISHVAVPPLDPAELDNNHDWATCPPEPTEPSGRDQ